MKGFHNFVFYFTLIILIFFLKAEENTLNAAVAEDDAFCYIQHMQMTEYCFNKVMYFKTLSLIT